MKRLMMLAACAVLTGCDYTVSLVDAPDRPIDKTIVGLWQRTNDDAKVEELLVLPLNANEYFVSYPAESRKAMYARGCLARVDDMDLVQLTWFGTAEGAVPDDGQVYQYVTYALAGDVLTVNLLNANVVEKGDAASQGIAAALRAKKGDPELFKEPMVFQKVKE